MQTQLLPLLKGQSGLKGVCGQLRRSEDLPEYWWPGNMDDAPQRVRGRVGWHRSHGCERNTQRKRKAGLFKDEFSTGNSHANTLLMQILACYVYVKWFRE